MPSEYVHNPRFVSYLRVSTDKQGRSGLGLEAQRQAVAAYLRQVNHGAQVLEEFVEVESGRKADRPQLRKARERCELTGATLLIARLDRLSRNARFLLELQESRVLFKACDAPHADNFTVGIMALVAQKEAEAISERTRLALKAAKARGTKLGCPNGAAHLKGRGNKEAVAALKASANAQALRLKGQIETIRSEGHATLTAIAEELERRNIKTPRGGRWHPMAVKRLLERIAG
ncbi:MAG: recombinase family protein [Proteobacteria bacterium]|nr:recombinase family protein [Pseudomonadota bacterium]